MMYPAMGAVETGTLTLGTPDQGALQLPAPGSTDLGPGSLGIRQVDVSSTIDCTAETCGNLSPQTPAPQPPNTASTGFLSSFGSISTGTWIMVGAAVVAIALLSGSGGTPKRRRRN